MNFILPCYFPIFWLAWLMQFYLPTWTSRYHNLSLLSIKPLGGESLSYLSCRCIFTALVASHGNKNMIEIVLCICPIFNGNSCNIATCKLNIFYFSLQLKLFGHTSFWCVLGIQSVGGGIFMLCWVIMFFWKIELSPLKTSVFWEWVWIIQESILNDINNLTWCFWLCNLFYTSYYLSQLRVEISGIFCIWCWVYSTLLILQNMLQTGMIVGGWDKYEGGKIYGIPLGGTILEQPFTIGGVFSHLLIYICPVCFSAISELLACSM